MEYKKIFVASVMFFICTVFAGAQTEITDPGVEINGIIWATRNVDAPGRFVENPEDIGMFYQWNSRIGWSATDPLIPSDGVSEWLKHTGTNTPSSWEIINDPCPSGWRVPTKEEYESLIGVGGEYVVLNEIRVFAFRYGDNIVYFPLKDARDHYQGRLFEMEMGAYWTATPAFDSYHYVERFFVDWMDFNSASTSFGHHIRCVKGEDEMTYLSEIQLEPASIQGFYSFLGVKLSQEPERGMYIIVYTDGTVQKVMK
jgi:uncharacterized protein (TIGR02145 family)